GDARGCHTRRNPLRPPLAPTRGHRRPLRPAAVLPAGCATPRTAHEIQRPPRLLLPERSPQKLGHRAPQTVPHPPRPAPHTAYPPSLRSTAPRRHPPNKPPPSLRHESP